MKKLFAVILAFALMVPCALADANPDDALIDMAQDMAERMTALCGIDAYASLSVGSPEIKEIIGGWAGDWAQRENCRRAAVIHIAQDTLETVYPAVIEPFGMGDLAAFGDVVIPRFSLSLSTMLNSTADSAWIAAVSIMACSDICVLNGFEPGYAFVLLDYFGADHPLIMATFRFKEDGAASINAMFVPSGEYTNSVFDIADGSVDLHRLASDALAEQEPQLARALLAALEEIRVTDYYF